MAENKQHFKLTDWQFRQYGEKSWLKAHVPSFVQTDLRDNGLINDPFYGDNELHLQWIDKVDWEYQTCFSVDEKILTQDHIELVCNGLDTYATVYLNNQVIIEANNMFRIWRKEIKPMLLLGENQLLIHFRSPIVEDLPKLDLLGYQLPATNDDSVTGGLEKKKVSVFARKAPYHYGWDWGPRFVTSGIWKDVECVVWSELTIKDFYINQSSITQQRASIVAELTVESTKSWQGEVVIQTEDHKWCKDINLDAGENIIYVPLEIKDPKLWWSRGLGEPYQYIFKAKLVDNNRLITEEMIKTGLRSVKLIREPDRYGSTFYIELNGEPVFLKGANHIPNDSFVTDVTNERYQYEIESAIAANMNAIRVWGGGIYEKDIFYQLCDEHGLFVWQDFMFACSMYPGDQTFLDNVEQEAIDILKRLRKHPSIVLWCGNNEIDSAWAHYNEHAGWGWKNEFNQEMREKLWNDYKTIFHTILARQTKKYAPNEPYWSSSPLVNLTGDKHQHATSVSGSGDLHYWEVWHGRKPFDAYSDNVARFMSEYGFQSFPEFRTVKTFADQKDFAIESDIMLHHQKNGAGNRLIKTYMDSYLPEPKDFCAFLYMSQILQAEAIKIAIEAHRRRMPYCMGTLYWQINDCWPVASWSSMDYYGRWKALHYQVKRAFKETIVSFEQTDSYLNIYGISDKNCIQSVDLLVRVYNLDGSLIKEEKTSANIHGKQSKMITSYSTPALLGNRSRSELVVIAELFGDENQSIDRQEHYFVRTKDLTLPRAKISITPTAIPNEFELYVDAFAKYIWLETESLGYFSDNYFDLLPGEMRCVQFIPRNKNELTPVSVVAQSLIDQI